MAFREYICRSAAVDLRADEKSRALNELLGALCKSCEIRKTKSISEDLYRREEAASTFIGNGLAIPQVRGPVKKEFAIVVGRSIGGIQYDAARGAKAQIIVMVMVREDVDAGMVVAMLREIASFFKSEIVREKILSVDVPVDILGIAESFTKKPQDAHDAKSPRPSAYPILKAAIALVREAKAKAILIFADAVRENDFLDLIKTRTKLIIITSTKTRFNPEDKRISLIIQAPSFPGSRTGQMRIGALLALSHNIITKNDTVICVSGNSKTGAFDTVVSLDVAREYEFFFTTSGDILPSDVKPETLERVLGLAGEIAVEGREGRPTGTIFVVGDTNSVNVFTRQLIINPFRGYSEAERNILDPGLEETIKEFAGIDGAFVITGDGIVLSAGSYLRPQASEAGDLPSGFGARHAAAAGITACTNALAITISESTGMVTVFKNGAIMMSLARPVIRGKRMLSKVLQEE